MKEGSFSPEENPTLHVIWSARTQRKKPPFSLFGVKGQRAECGIDGMAGN